MREKSERGQFEVKKKRFLMSPFEIQAVPCRDGEKSLGVREYGKNERRQPDDRLEAQKGCFPFPLDSALVVVVSLSGLFVVIILCETVHRPATRRAYIPGGHYACIWDSDIGKCSCADAGLRVVKVFL